MTSYEQILAQAADAEAKAAQLKARADEILSTERQNALVMVNEMIGRYDLQLADLIVKVKPATNQASKAPSIPKFRNADGKTWSGKGRLPDWYKNASHEHRLAMAI